jgi:hypothetical protein
LPQKAPQKAQDGDPNRCRPRSQPLDAGVVCGEHRGRRAAGSGSPGATRKPGRFEAEPGNAAAAGGAIRSLGRPGSGQGFELAAAADDKDLVLVSLWSTGKRFTRFVDVVEPG